MNVGIGTVPAQFLSWENCFESSVFGSLQCMHVSIPEPGRDVVRLDLLDDSPGLVVGKGGGDLVPLEEHGEQAGHL
jgi:hypothetical protein